MRPKTLRWAVVGMLLAALVVGGCAKKQVRQGGEETPKVTVTPEKPTPPPAAKVVEKPQEAPPQPSEPPPGETGAVEPAPKEPVKGAGLARETTPGLERIHFDFDKAVIRPDAQEILRRNAEFLKANPGVRIRIEGHCDERGTTEYNLALGERRAKAAFQYLMDLGVDPNRMSVVSYGEAVPLDPGHNEEAWAKNRRAEFVEVEQ
ncbi:peptidoglycan-associated lipoprotein Pal [Deferrisoma camini]|uniref:peptidoglycan-associated lipoprotein Pal n=1 Tax=Deferrisoma camini TaxID=1035120 RepID=UPI00046D7FE4|nr:peptidoglycan-associated lipoprotein Pal [Deferrisoma camini]